MAPTADFTATPTSGYTPLSVDFTDNSTVTGATTFLWTFGDGYTSTAQDPTHTYASVGSYTVSLKVTDITGTDTETKYNYVIAAPTNTLLKTEDTDVDPSQGLVRRMLLTGDAEHNNILKAIRVYVPAGTQNPNESGFRRPYGPGLIAD